MAVALGYLALPVFLKKAMADSFFKRRLFGKKKRRVTLGMWCGAVTPTEAIIAAIIDLKYLKGLFELATDIRFHNVVMSLELTKKTVKKDKGRRSITKKIKLAGLIPNTKYYYRFLAKNRKHDSLIGEFETFPDKAASFRFAFGSCAETGSTSKAFTKIREANPLFFIHGGDLHYENIRKDKVRKFRKGIRKAITSRTQAELYRNIPIAYIWDDHDYGANNSHSESPARKSALKAYRECVPHYPLVNPAGDRTIEQAFSVGRVRFVMTDLRSEKTPCKEKRARRTVMGEKQLKWFKNEILTASSSHKLVVWINSIPWIGKPELGSDSWDGYQEERENIANFIASKNIKNLMLISGDAHMLGLDDGTHSDYSLTKKAPLVVFHAAAMGSRKNPSLKGGPYSHGAFPGKEQFGIIDIKDEGGDKVSIHLSGQDSQGRELIKYNFSV